MLSYRIIATRHGDDIICRAQIHAWDEHDKTWAWQPVHTWSLPSRADADLSTVLSHNLATNGWQAAPDSIPPALPATIPVEPCDYALVLLHISEHIAELSRYKSALKSAVANIPDKGQRGHISTTEISRITGLSRAQLTTYRRTPPRSTDSSDRP